jgi:hypothetical protein
LLDPLDTTQAAWNREMEPLMKQYAIPFVMRPLPPGDAAKALELAKEVRSMPEPVTVIAPQTPLEDGKATPGTATAVAFLRAYGTVAPTSLAAKPNWHLNHAAKGGVDSTAGTVER